MPVRAWPMRSSPASASGRVSSWMAKVRSMPASASACDDLGRGRRARRRWGSRARTGGARPAAGALPRRRLGGFGELSGELSVVDGQGDRLSPRTGAGAGSSTAGTTPTRRESRRGAVRTRSVAAPGIVPGGLAVGAHPVRALRSAIIPGRRHRSVSRVADVSRHRSTTIAPIGRPVPAARSTRPPADRRRARRGHPRVRIRLGAMTTAPPPPRRPGIGRAGAGHRPDRATVDLLGVLAYGELSAFDRLAEDARQAPTLAGRAALSTMAAAEIGHFRPARRAPARHGRGDRGRDGPVRRPARLLPRLDRAAELAGVAGQGLRGRRAGRRLLPRDLRLAARAPPARWCSRCWPTPGTARSPSARCGRRAQADRQDARPAGAVGAAAARRGGDPGAAHRRRARRAGRVHRHRHPATWPASRRCSSACSSTTASGWPSSG